MQYLDVGLSFLFFFKNTATAEIYTLSLHDALPICGFRGRRGGTDAAGSRVPPGQYVTSDFPVLSAGPTPRTRPEDWSFALQHGGSLLAQWSWAEFQALPPTRISVDIHSVTKRSKPDTGIGRASWRGRVEIAVV